MIILSWNIRDVGQVGFKYEAMELSRLYHVDIIFLMETKVNNNMDNNIRQLSRIFPFFISTSFYTIYKRTVGVMEKFTSIPIWYFNTSW